jgi:ribosome-associated toxin RatA of RatAB toxin-antitoxin module
MNSWSLRFLFYGLLSVQCLPVAAQMTPSVGNSVPWPDPPMKVEPDEEEWKRLREGEVVMRTRRTNEAGGGGLALALFQVDVEALWFLIGDCATNRRFVQGLRDCEVFDETRTRARTRQRLKPFTFAPTLTYEFETVREPFEWIRIRLIEGDLMALEGSWRFEPLDGAWLLVSHDIHVQPGLPVPRWLARRTVQRDLAALMACLRWEARAWPDPRQRGLDRQRCPEP